MKNKIIELSDSKKIIVVDEITLENHRYIYGLEYNNQSHDIINNHFVLEVKIKNNNLIVSDVKDINLLLNVTNIFLERLK